MSKAKIQSLINQITLGYGAGNTMDSALKNLVPKYNEMIGTSFSPEEVLLMMDGESVISCRGLDNYFYKVYEKMQESKTNVISVA